MSIIFRVFFLFLFSFHLMAGDVSSDSERSDSEEMQPIALANALTVDEVFKFLYDQEKIEPWIMLHVFGFSALAAGVLTLVPGIGGTALSCIYCQTCSNSSDHCSITLDNSGCITGLSLVSTVGLFWLETLCTPIITKIQHAYARVKNDRLERCIRQQLATGRLKDIRDIGLKLIANRSDLLTKLPLAQVLLLAELDLIKLMQVEDKFSQEIQTVLKKLENMLKMDADELANMLNNNRAKDLFTSNKGLWPTLVRMLPDEIRNNQNIRQGLMNILVALLDELNAKEIDLDAIFANVLQGFSIEECLLKEVVVDDETKDDEELTIKTEIEEKDLVAKKGDLIKVSRFFKKWFSNKWQSNSVLNLSHVNYDWVQLVVDVAAEKDINFYQVNLWSVIAGANYFSMPDVLKRCDNFVVENDLLKKLVKTWLKENSEHQDKISFADLWKFCKIHSFHQNQKILLRELATKLNDLSIEDASVLEDMRLLSNKNMEAIINKFDLKKFQKRLKNQEFLHWAWDAVKEFPFLKTAVANFCVAEKTLTERTWALIPDDLALAIAAKNY